MYTRVALEIKFYDLLINNIIFFKVLAEPDYKVHQATYSDRAVVCLALFWRQNTKMTTHHNLTKATEHHPSMCELRYFNSCLFFGR